MVTPGDSANTTAGAHWRICLAYYKHAEIHVRRSFDDTENDIEFSALLGISKTTFVIVVLRCPAGKIVLHVNWRNMKNRTGTSAGGPRSCWPRKALPLVLCSLPGVHERMRNHSNDFSKFTTDREQDFRPHFAAS